MSDTTWERIEVEAPQLSSLSQAQKDIILEDVILQIPESVWGDAEERAQRYLGAHYGSLMQSSSGNNSGPVTSKSVGSVSISYGSTNQKDGNRYDETVYGRKYILLRKATLGDNFRVYRP